MAASKSRRPKMLWAPTTLGEDECTRVDDHPPWDVVAQAPGLNPSHLTIEIPSLASRSAPMVMSERAIPMAPLPRRANQATPAPPMSTQPAQPMMIPQAQPPAMSALFVPRMEMPMDRAAVVPAPLSPSNFYSYAETCARQHLDSTAPVAPLPFAELATNSFPRQIPRWSKIAMPIAGVAAFSLFLAAFVASRDDRPALPPITSVSRAEAAPIQLAAAHAAAPTEIPADSKWKPRNVVPTMAAEAPAAVAVEEVAAPAAAPEVEVAAEEAVPEIEIAPVATKKERKHRSRASKKSLARVAAQAPSESDPILAEIAKPGSSAKPKASASGPGKAVVSSDLPSLVYIDGRATSLRTPTTINLSPGAHKITLIALSTRKAKTVDVDIKSGSSVPVHREFGSSSSSSSSSGKSKSSGKNRQVKVDASTPLGSLRPGKAF